MDSQFLYRLLTIQFLTIKNTFLRKYKQFPQKNPITNSIKQMPS